MAIKRFEKMKSPKGLFRLEVIKRAEEVDGGEAIFEYLDVKTDNDFVVSIRLEGDWGQSYSQKYKAAQMKEEKDEVAGKFRSNYSSYEVCYGLHMSPHPNQDIAYIKQFCEVLEDACALCEKLDKFFEEWNDGWDYE